MKVKLLTFVHPKKIRKSILGLFSREQRSLYWASIISLVRKRPINSQIIRHIVQFLFLVFVILTPFLFQYGHLLFKNDLQRALWDWPPSFQRTSLVTVEKIYRATEPGADKEEILKQLENVRGNTWSAHLFGLSLTDPLGGAESMLASRKVTKTILLGITIPVLATLLLGRVFCSWICPVGFLLEMGDKIREPLKHLFSRWKIPLQNDVFWRGNKFVFLGVGLLLSFLVGVPILGDLYPPALFVREVNHEVRFLFDLANNKIFRFTLGGLTGATLFLVLIAFVELFVSERMWCRYLCPGGALYALLGSKRVIRVRRDTFKCTECADCNKVCGMGLNPMQDSTGIECDNCLACTSICSEDALHTQFSLKSTPIHTKQNKQNNSN